MWRGSEGVQGGVGVLKASQSALVDTITEGRHLFYGLIVIGVHGGPLISFSFETSKEAEAAHKAMLSIVATAKIITPHALSR
jgi:hypothetical protein